MFLLEYSELRFGSWNTQGSFFELKMGVIDCLNIFWGLTSKISYKSDSPIPGTADIKSDNMLVGKNLPTLTLPSNDHSGLYICLFIHMSVAEYTWFLAVRSSQSNIVLHSCIPPVIQSIFLLNSTLLFLFSFGDLGTVVVVWNMNWCSPNQTSTFGSRCRTSGCHNTSDQHCFLSESPGDA